MLVQVIARRDLLLMEKPGRLHRRQELWRYDLGFLGDHEEQSESVLHYDTARHKDRSEGQSLQTGTSALSWCSV